MIHFVWKSPGKVRGNEFYNEVGTMRRTDRVENAVHGRGCGSLLTCFVLFLLTEMNYKRNATLSYATTIYFGNKLIDLYNK